VYAYITKLLTKGGGIQGRRPRLSNVDQCSKPAKMKRGAGCPAPL